MKRGIVDLTADSGESISCAQCHWSWTPKHDANHPMPCPRCGLTRKRKDKKKPKHEDHHSVINDHYAIVLENDKLKDLDHDARAKEEQIEKSKTCPRCTVQGIEASCKRCHVCEFEFESKRVEIGFKQNLVLDRMNCVQGNLAKELPASLRISDVVATVEGKIEEAWVCTMDLAHMVTDEGECFLFHCFPELKQVKDLIVVLGHKPSDEVLNMYRVFHQSIEFHAPKCMPFGVHHSKGFVLFYGEMVRVCIHTSNLCPYDLDNKSEGVWFMDFPRKAEDSRDKSSSEFEDDVVRYYRYVFHQHHWKPRVEKLKEFDFSNANVSLVTSVPGTHKPSKGFGLYAVSRHLRHLPEAEKSWPLVCQFTSLGSQGTDKQPCWLTDSLAKDAFCRTSDNVQVVFPSARDCQKSIVGFAHGIHGKDKDAIKIGKERFYRWAPSYYYRSREFAIPHFKSYCAYDPQDPRRLSFACITSANGSQAAWGRIKKDGDIYIRSFELGVLFHGKKTFVAYPDENFDREEIVLPIPYKLPPEPYDWSNGDSPGWNANPLNDDHSTKK